MRPESVQSDICRKEERILDECRNDELRVTLEVNADDETFWDDVFIDEIPDADKEVGAD